MSIDAPKLRVLIPTTTGPVEVLLLTEEDAAIGRCVACIGGTTETADIAAAYHAFVVRPTGVIESLFGHPCYRLDVSGRIDAGSSWQLGVLTAHALHAAGRLAQENDAADGVIWVTGSVRPVDLTVGGVSHVPEKLACSMERLEQEIAAGRTVCVLMPADNASALSAQLRDDLAARGIAVIALADVQSLSDHLSLNLPAAAPAAARRREARSTRWLTASNRRVGAAAAIALACVALGAGALYPLLRQPPAPADRASTPPAQVAPPPLQREAEALLPETVPFVSDRDRDTIRTVYLPAPDAKALALSSHAMGFSTDQQDDASARDAAMAACQRAMEEQRVRSRCEIYAVGLRVVSGRGRPPLPPHPWIVRNRATETAFVTRDVPLVDEEARRAIEREYPRGRSPKALALSATGRYNAYLNQGSPEEAVRRALERCGSNAGAACIIIALDDVFVVPIPRSMKVVGLVQPGTLVAIRPELRRDVVAQLVDTASGWSAVAIGAAGSVGTSLGADSERAAVNGAVADCSRRDLGCRIMAIGPFLVEDVASARAVDTEKLAKLAAALGTFAPALTISAREDLASKYETLKEHKALAVVPGTSLNFRTGEWPTAEAAEEIVLERCQLFHGNPCAAALIDDVPQAARIEGTSARDMARVRYAGVFDPERIPGISSRVRARPDIAQYREAAGPKAAAVHSWGRVFTVLSAENQHAAETLALAACNNDPSRRGQDGPCHLYAIGDQVVLPRRLTAPPTP